MNILELLPVMSALIGIIIGFVLNEISYRIREKHRNKIQKKSVSLLIRLEIDFNLSILTNYWSRVTNNNVTSKISEEIKLDYCRNLTEFPDFKFSRISSDSQLYLLGKHYSDIMINKIVSVYYDLDKLTNIKNELAYLLFLEEEKVNKFHNNQISSKIRYNPWPKFSFLEKAPELWDNFSEIANNIIKNGNPLAD
ncbi:MAG: hypothetical protein H8D45_05860 [Bacteroidetes bacterium]|nr:hypothetical protein [Bacteroidota bacterium]